MPRLKSVKPSGKKDESFFELVYEVARQIPKGKVKPKVPAHRVVNRIGMLSGKHHFSPPGSMEKSLKKEGIKVKNDKIVDFEKHFWDPVKEVGF